MKKICFTLVSFFLVIHYSTAQTIEFDSTGYRAMQVGTMMQKADVWIIRVGDINYAQDYYPINLGDQMKIEGQKVVFAGAVGSPPPNVRMIGIPLRIASIRKLSTVKAVGAEKNETAVKQNVSKKGNSDFDSVGYLKNVSGKIITINDTYLIEQNEQGDTHRYFDPNMPNDFKKENMMVTFSGIIGKPAANVRLMGTPFKITEMMAAEDIILDKSQIQEPLKDYYPVDSAGYLNTIDGVVKLMMTEPDVYIIEVADNGGTKRYLPVIIPIEFRIDGLKVRVSGIVGKVAANVRMIGTPLDVKTIQKAN
jgi:hypothetical protein